VQATITKLYRGAIQYGREVRKFNRNIRLLLIASVLSGIAQGIFSVDFNLYILSLGLKADVLGEILSVGPFAHALGSIPVGLLGEFVGYKKAFLAIYALAGFSQLAQVATSNKQLIMTAAFIAGLAFAGDFVVRLPFLAASAEDSGRTHVFSLNSLLTSISFSAGALLAGYAPDLLYWLSPDLAIRYRYTLYISGALTLLAAIPALMIRDDMLPKTKKITLRPYLWGMDSFTVKLALIELFVGLTMGLVTPFMNVFFIYRLGTSREFFGTIAALALVPITAATALGPIIATRMGNIRAVIALRFLIPLCTVTMAMTTYPLLGTAAYWAYRALFMVSQSIWFAFAMETATPKAKVAASAWLEITFWIGMGLAARVTGIFFAQSNYALPFYISSIAAVLTGLLTQILVSSYHAPVSSVDKPARRI